MTKWYVYIYRRRLEPLLEEDGSESGSEDNKPTPTNPETQVTILHLDKTIAFVYYKIYNVNFFL